MPETVCRVLDLLVTEQVEDPHVDYTVEDLRFAREGGLGMVARAHQPGRLVLGDRLREERCQLIVRRGFCIYI